ncbi:hypothetical protein HK096_008909 [Nowakowskiella sp. JEL0078]|nr:hypothetical protein HK096_008909 [Nowakowskiella sp. JEL0078]
MLGSEDRGNGINDSDAKNNLGHMFDDNFNEDCYETGRPVSEIAKKKQMLAKLQDPLSNSTHQDSITPSKSMQNMAFKPSPSVNWNDTPEISPQILNSRKNKCKILTESEGESEIKSTKDPQHAKQVSKKIAKERATILHKNQPQPPLPSTPIKTAALRDFTQPSLTNLSSCISSPATADFGANFQQFLPNTASRNNSALGTTSLKERQLMSSTMHLAYLSLSSLPGTPSFVAGDKVTPEDVRLASNILKNPEGNELESARHINEYMGSLG